MMVRLIIYFSLLNYLPVYVMRFTLPVYKKTMDQGYLLQMDYLRLPDMLRLLR